MYFIIFFINKFVIWQRPDSAELHNHTQTRNIHREVLHYFTLVLCVVRISGFLEQSLFNFVFLPPSVFLYLRSSILDPWSPILIFHETSVGMNAKNNGTYESDWEPRRHASIIRPRYGSSWSVWVPNLFTTQFQEVRMSVSEFRRNHRGNVQV